MSYLDKFDNLDFDLIFQKVIQHNYQTSYEKRKQQVKRQDNIRASTIGYCIRRQYLDDAEAGEEIPDSLKTVFAHGTFIHDQVVLPLFKTWAELSGLSHNFVVLNEFPFAYNVDDMLSRGFVDDMIMVFDNGETFYIPIEIKSIGNAFYKIKEPEIQHYAQVLLYMGIFQAKFGYVVYVHKGTLSTKTFKVYFDERSFNTLLERGKELFKFKNDGIIPYAEAMVENEKKTYWFTKRFLNLEGEHMKDQCDGCQYLSFCLQNKDEIKPEDDEDW